MTVRLLIFLSLFVFPSASKAEWQWANWGMSPTEVVGLSGGKASIASDTERSGKNWTRNNQVVAEALVRSRHVAGGINFDVWFMFTPNSRNLNCVRLTPTDPVLRDQLEASLVATYGPVINRARMPAFRITEATWMSEKNEIKLKTFMDSINIDYCDRKSASAGF
jgi:hypothetical protein